MTQRYFVTCKSQYREDLENVFLNNKIVFERAQATIFQHDAIFIADLSFSDLSVIKLSIPAFKIL